AQAPSLVQNPPYDFTDNRYRKKVIHLSICYAYHSASPDSPVASVYDATPAWTRTHPHLNGLQRNSMYQYDAIDQQLVDQRVAQFRDQTRRYLNGEITDQEFLPLRLQNGLYIQRL